MIVWWRGENQYMYSFDEGRSFFASPAALHNTMSERSSRKKSYGSVSLKLSNTLKGRCGILFTCFKGREHAAKREIANVLAEIVEDAAETSSSVARSSKNDNKTASDALAEEINALRASKAQRGKSFRILDSGVTGVLLSAIRKPHLDPDALVSKVFREMQSTNKVRFRECIRVLPMQVVTSATLRHVVEASRPLIDKYFPKGGTKKFRVVYRNMMCETLRRKELILKVASLVDSTYAVDLMKPDLTVLIIGIRGICGVAVSPHHHALCDYNVNTLIRQFVSEDGSTRGRKRTQGSRGEHSSASRKEAKKKIRTDEK